MRPGGKFPCVHMETELVPLAVPEDENLGLRVSASRCRDHGCPVCKSPYEISHAVQARSTGSSWRTGPPCPEEGMSEAELSAILFNIMMEEGYHGVTVRYVHTEMVPGR